MCTELLGYASESLVSDVRLPISTDFSFISCSLTQTLAILLLQNLIYLNSPPRWSSYCNEQDATLTSLLWCMAQCTLQACFHSVNILHSGLLFDLIFFDHVISGEEQSFHNRWNSYLLSEIDWWCSVYAHLEASLGIWSQTVLLSLEYTTL